MTVAEPAADGAAGTAALAPHPFLLRLATRLLGKADRSASPCGTRLKLDRPTAPELYGQVDAEELRRLQLLIDDCCATGWVRLRLDKARDFAGWIDRNPQLELLDFDALARWAGFQRRADQWQRQLLAHLVTHWAPAPGTDPAALQDYLLRNPLSALAEMPPADAMQCLAALQRLCSAGAAMPLRVASARVFQGRSKVLDNRDELLRLLGAAPRQFQEAPIQLLVDLPARFDEALFVENLVTFEQMADQRRPAWSRTLLVYAAGFKGSARRLRTHQACRLYLRAGAGAGAGTGTGDALAGDPAMAAGLPAGSAPGLVEGLSDVPSDVLSDRAWDRLGELGEVRAWLFGQSPLPVRFFGDLDFAGLQILASLREVFADAQAWRPGYDDLAERLAAGGGHGPEAAAKERQTDPLQTGCAYADGVLLPLIRRVGRFVDQEVFDVGA